MIVGRIGLALLLGGTGVHGSEMDVHLFDQTSTIVVARSDGLVTEKLLDVNQLVQNGDEILILYQDQERKSVIATSDGLFKEYADSIHIGAEIEKGDVIAVLLSNEIKGVLIPNGEETFPKLFSAGSTYCCLNAGGIEFNIDILNIRKEGQNTWYYFSIIDVTSFLSLLQDKTLTNSNVSFEFVKKIEPFQTLASED